MKFQEHSLECSAHCLVMHGIKDSAHMLLCDSEERTSSVQGDAVSLSCFSEFHLLQLFFWKHDQLKKLAPETALTNFIT